LTTAVSLGRSRSALSARFAESVAWALAVFLALTPLPVGSNRPLFWALNAAVIGVLGLFYCFSRFRGSVEATDLTAPVRVPAALFLVVGAYALLQALPLGLPQLIGAYTANLDARLDELGPATISIAPLATLLALMQWLTLGGLFFFALHAGSYAYLRRLLLNGIILVAAAYALLALFSLSAMGDTMLGLPKWAYLGAATGPFVNRNSFATYLAIGAIVTTALLFGRLFRRGHRERRPAILDGTALLYLLALAVQTGALAATQSRMGLFCAIIGVGVVTAIASTKIARGGRRAIALAGLAAVLGLSLLLFGGGLVERLGSAETEADVRSNLYAQVVELILLRPWTGFGFGAFEAAFPLVHDLPVSPDYVWDKAHNTYLALAAELGVVVGAVPILIACYCGVHAARGVLRSKDWATCAAALGVVAAVGAHALVDFSLEIQAVAMQFTLVLSLGLAAAADRSAPGGPSRHD
jgi:O-antigen ligase